MTDDQIPDALMGWLASRVALAVRRLRLEPWTDWDDFLSGCVIACTALRAAWSSS